MSWLEFFEGFSMMIFRSEPAISFWAAREVPLWQTCLVTILWTSLTLILTYRGSGWLVNKLKQWWLLEIIIERIEQEIAQKKILNRKRRNTIHKNLVEQLASKKNWVVLTLGFVPLVPFLPTAVIVVAGASSIKYGQVILLVGNVFRRIVMCYVIYQGIQLLFL